MALHIPSVFSQYVALSLRERMLAVAACIGVLFLLVEFGWVQPQQKEAKALRQRIEQQGPEYEALAQALRARAASPQDPLAARRQERDALRAEIARAESVVGPAANDVRMGQLVRALVASNPGVTLVSLKTLPVETFAKAPESPGAPASAAAASAARDGSAAARLPALYRHGIEVTLQGQYVTLVPYLQALERSSNGIFWGTVRFAVSAYPDATLTLTLFTLSVHPELPLG